MHPLRHHCKPSAPRPRRLAPRWLKCLRLVPSICAKWTTSAHTGCDCSGQRSLGRGVPTRLQSAPERSWRTRTVAAAPRRLRQSFERCGNAPPKSGLAGSRPERRAVRSDSPATAFVLAYRPAVSKRGRRYAMAVRRSGSNHLLAIAVSFAGRRRKSPKSLVFQFKAPIAQR